MLSNNQLRTLLNNIEDDNVERTISMTNMDKFGEAICAFANDLPNHRQPGYLIIGANDDGSLANLNITDQFLQTLSDFTNGRILPIPVISVSRYELNGSALAIVEVLPAAQPPVRYKSKVHVRIGPRKSVANEAEERILVAKRTSNARTFDALPCLEAALNDLNTSLIQLSYFPLTIDRETLEANHRDLKQQLASLRLYDLQNDKPSNAAILFFALNTQYFFSGSYIQYIKIDSLERNLDKVVTEQTFRGSLLDELNEIESYVRHNIVKSRPVRVENTFQDRNVSNYPYNALREFIMNAIMHRDYESNAPIYIYEYIDRIEISNSGGLYGDVRPENFPNASDYRNPVIAEIMKNKGYVNRFNFGIQDAQRKLAENNNPPAEFDLSLITRFLVTLKINPEWLNE
ncbi:MAG: putative DNA binding domain-containing protein [Sphingobacteriales bacterium]|jgi:ATP-dependent DNA helicase RecG|nr:putative DNA binding domain-containing protein [Sphingobacteriales bacterium]